MSKFASLTSQIVKFFSGKDMPVQSDKVFVIYEIVPKSGKARVFPSCDLLKVTRVDKDGTPLYTSTDTSSKNPHKAKFYSDGQLAGLFCDIGLIDLAVTFAKAGAIRASEAKAAISKDDKELVASAILKRSTSKRLSASEKAAYKTYLEAEAAKMS